MKRERQLKIRLRVSRKKRLLNVLAAGWLFLFTCIALSLFFWSWAEKGSFLNPDQAYLPPFSGGSQVLGTDQLGRDLLFYLLHACQTAWLITFPPLLIATVIGISLGALAAYFGNRELKIRVDKLFSASFILIAGLSLFPYFKWRVLSTLATDSISFTGALLFHFTLLTALFFLCCKLPFPYFKRFVSIPLDLIVRKSIEIWSTLPKLLLLLLLSTLSSPSMFTLIGWIAISFWVLPARLTRSKVLELKNLPFIETALAQGVPGFRLFYKHLAPFLLRPILTNFCFSASGLLGIGATLAYLGVGLPPEVPSWGKMLSNARFSVDAWWLVVFPSLFLLGSIFSLQTLGQSFFQSKTR